jgi:hypothetical protein
VGKISTSFGSGWRRKNFSERAITFQSINVTRLNRFLKRSFRDCIENEMKKPMMTIFPPGESPPRGLTDSLVLPLHFIGAFVLISVVLPAG